MPKRIRTRFAPSPTGPLHIGGVRTALFNYLFARKNGGDFILRIEDTDMNRYVEGAEEYIVEALRWCGIIIDEGVSAGGRFSPYRQSERNQAGIYKNYALQLIASGHAYYAFDTPAEIEAMRQRYISQGETAPQYNHLTRMQMVNSLTLTEEALKGKLEDGTPAVIRLKVPSDETISFTDMIRGEVSFNSSTLDDKVLLKSDGMPTYHLAHIVDDVLMEISHAIRGEEWLPSAPAHILIYKYLGLESVMPHYAHLPLLLKPDGNGKLSKRDGDRLGFPVFPLSWKDPVTGELSVGYRERGYYPDAFVNMLAFLGWNPGTEQELFTMQELCEAFSFEHVHKAGARFDPDKAKWFNEQYLRKKPSHEIARNLTGQAVELFQLPADDQRLSAGFMEGVVRLTQERVQFEQDILQEGHYLFVAPTAYDEPVIAKKWKPGVVPFFEMLASGFKSATSFTKDDIDSEIKRCASASGLKAGEIMQLLRVLISGKGSGVDLIGMIGLLGPVESAARLEKGLAFVNSLGLPA